MLSAQILKVLTRVSAILDSLAMVATVMMSMNAMMGHIAAHEMPPVKTDMDHIAVVVELVSQVMD